MNFFVDESIDRQIVSRLRRDGHAIRSEWRWWPRGCTCAQPCAAGKKANARMVTSAMIGTFKKNQATRSEFFGHIGREHVGF